MKLSFGLLKCRTSLLNSGIENRDLSQRSKSSKRQNHEKEVIMLKTGCVQLQKQELLPPPQMRCSGNMGATGKRDPYLSMKTRRCSRLSGSTRRFRDWQNSWGSRKLKNTMLMEGP